MERCEYYDQDDIFRIIDLDDMIGYVFKFNNREDLVRMYDDNGDGEMAEDHALYTDSYDEICFLYPSYEQPSWPVIAEF